MAKENIAVEGFDFDWVSDSGDISVTENVSDKNKIGGEKIADSLTIFDVSDVETPNVEEGTGVGIFIGSLKVKSEGNGVIRENDIAIVTGVGKNKSAPPPTLPFVSAIEITDAKQTKVKAE